MKRVVVFGYGPVGREITALLAARGDDVLVAQRSAPKQLPAGATFISCDVTDANSVAAATAGREIAICTVGFRLFRPHLAARLAGRHERDAERLREGRRPVRLCRQSLYVRAGDRAAHRDHAAHELRAKAAHPRRDHPSVARRPCGGARESGRGARFGLLWARRAELHPLDGHFTPGRRQGRARTLLSRSPARSNLRPGRCPHRCHAVRRAGRRLRPSLARSQRADADVPRTADACRQDRRRSLADAGVARPGCSRSSGSPCRNSAS